MSEEMVTIPLSEYKALNAAADKLAALEEIGVDNWEGYGDAMQVLRDAKAAKAGAP